MLRDQSLAGGVFGMRRKSRKTSPESLTFPARDNDLAAVRKSQKFPQRERPSLGTPAHPRVIVFINQLAKINPVG